MNAPAPGIYENIDFDQYTSWRAMNISTLLEGRRSMRHVKEAMDRPVRRRTASMWRGILGHTLVLEPVTAMDRYVVMPLFEDDPENLTSKGERPKNPTSTSWYRAKAKAFARDNITREVITQDKYDEIKGMVRALDINPKARKMLTGGVRELSMVWVDPNCGVVCKGRLDLVNEDEGFCLDLKVVEDASRFDHSIAKFHYDIRMASYMWGWSTLRGESLTPWLMAVEGSPPYGIRTAPVGDETMAIGLEQYRQLLSDYSRCLDRDEWPGYEDPDEWNLPGVGGNGMAIYGLKISEVSK